MAGGVGGEALLEERRTGKVGKSRNWGLGEARSETCAVSQLGHSPSPSSPPPSPLPNKGPGAHQEPEPTMIIRFCVPAGVFLPLVTRQPPGLLATCSPCPAQVSGTPGRRNSSMSDVTPRSISPARVLSQPESAGQQYSAASLPCSCYWLQCGLVRQVLQTNMEPRTSG